MLERVSAITTDPAFLRNLQSRLLRWRAWELCGSSARIARSKRCTLHFLRRCSAKQHSTLKLLQRTFQAAAARWRGKGAAGKVAKKRAGSRMREYTVLIARQKNGNIGISIYDPRLTSSPPTKEVGTEVELRATLTELEYAETEIDGILGVLRKGNPFGPKRRTFDEATLGEVGFSV
jgi:hypothetical protein